MGSFIPLESSLRKKGAIFIAGIDEAGRGPLAGPVVCAAVVLKNNARLPGLNSSKEISEKRREELFPKIIKNSVDYAISIVPPKIIDLENISNAIRWANYLCLHYLNTKPDITLIDGNDKQFIKTEFKTVIKGDARVRCIAAASVLAKVTRDYLMHHYHSKFPKYNFYKHKGYGTREHKSLLNKFGTCEIHRKSYNY
ncbi:ribonuclease HII [Candidatus Peregrinibacteria bacterium]|nr:ribonuclease HII [Candidatus Peregrinibacteria bacterium]